MTELTPREWEVVEQWEQALTSNAIALKLGISPRTVEAHISRIIEKTGAHNMRGAVLILRGQK